MIINVDRVENPLVENVLICDMYIKVKTGGSRTLDRVYAQSKTYFKYLRYGLTFLEFYSRQDPELCEKVELVRKGLMRVFELKIEYLLQELDVFVEKTKIMSQKDYNIRNYIIGEAYEILQSQTLAQEKWITTDVGSSNVQLEEKTENTDFVVELCHYVQTDGINVQVSWWPSLKCWSIGSYNVSILVSKREDLEKYPGHQKQIDDMSKFEIRYNYCHLIANAWFDLLDRLAEKHNELKSDPEKSGFYEVLSKWTMVGEFVGMESFQQILKYPSKSLIFSAIIENDKVNETCMLPEKWADFCQKWSLDYIPVNRVGFYRTKDELKQSLTNLYHKITSGSLNEYEEGSIMMLVLRNPNDPSQDRVLSCSKIKTVEYKVYK